MQEFRQLEARAVALMIDDVDTDMLFPARFAKTTADAGFGDCLLAELRFAADGTPRSDCPLNEPRHQGAQILVGGANFGCGSSREHAVWALRDFGFRAILAESFADIFYQNCFKNGLLPVALPRGVIASIAERVTTEPEIRIAIDLETCTVVVPGLPDREFETDPYRRDMLLRGIDEIGLTLESREVITTFAAQRFAAMPWLDPRRRHQE